MARLTLQETMDRLLLLIRAGYPVIYIVSHEETRVLDYLAKIVRVIKAVDPNKDKRLLRWSQVIGLEEFDSLSVAPDGHVESWLDVEGVIADRKTPISAVSAFDALNLIKNPQNDPKLTDSLTVFFDLHPYLRADSLTSPLGSLVRSLRNTADALRHDYDVNRSSPARRYKTIVIVAPSAVGLSMELERDLIVLDFPLPETEELRRTLVGMLPEKDAERLIGKKKFGKGILKFPEQIPAHDMQELCGSDVPAEVYQSRLCDLIAGAGRGLTLEDYKRGLNMFAVRSPYLQLQHNEDMLHLKAKGINNKALEYTPHIDIELGGLEGVKEWTRTRRDAVVSDSVRTRYRLPSPKGVMLCGASGGGKSMLAKLTAKEFNLALLRLDVGALFGMYVGESEERTRQALQMAEVLAPVVLWIDEVDKAFMGVGAGGDSGVSARVFGHFLTWLAEKQDSVFVVATANNFIAMLAQFPEFGRKGRFDEIFWVDLPDQGDRQRIFSIYLKPHFRDRYLSLTEDDVSRLATRENVFDPPQGQEVLDQFCWLLSHPNLSNNMTGAEIEYAINDALYKAYQESRLQPSAACFTAELVVDTIKAAMGRALYRPLSPDSATLGALRGAAIAKGWPWAGNRPAHGNGEGN